jgi:acyl-[acyl-carrier-protein] desaturase
MTERTSFEEAPSSELWLPSNVRRRGQEAILQSGIIIPGGEPNQIEVLRELEPVVADQLNRHNFMRKPWTPRDYMPIDQQTGRILHRVEDPDQAPLLSPEAQAAMIVNLLTEDNLPSYHRTIAENFGLDGPWGEWTHQWTAEEDSHAYAIRAFLDLTEAVDPAQNEAMRMEQMKRGYTVEKDPLHTLAYVTFQELATRVAHRQTGIATNNGIADAMLQRIAKDENLHMLFYRELAKSALDIAPNQMMQAIRDEVMTFEMPGANIKGFRVKALQIANADIYDLQRHLDEVVMPVLLQWKIFERDDFTGYGAKARDELAEFLVKLRQDAARLAIKRESGQLGRAIDALQARERD